MKKIVIFNYLRAISMLLIVYGHVIGYSSDSVVFLGPIAGHIEILDVSTRFQLLLAKYVNLGEIGVAMFLLLSGFLIVRSREGKTSSSFLVKRVIRILPISIGGTVVTYLALMSVNSYFFHFKWVLPLDALQALLTNSLLIYDLFPSNINNPVFATSILMPAFWFLAVIMKFYILMSFFQCITMKTSANIALGAFFCVLFFVYFRTSMSPNINYYLSVLAFSAHHILYIMIGSALYIVFRDFVFESKKILWTQDCWNPIVIFVLFVLSHKALTSVSGFPVPSDMVENYFISLIIFVLALFCCHRVVKANKIISFLSSISFSLYAIHFSVGAIFVYILGRYSYLREMPFVLYALVFLLTIGVGFLLYRLVEKPCSKLF